MIRLTLLVSMVATLVGCATVSPMATQPDMSAIRARALESGFDGTILIGQSDGSSTIISVGNDAPVANAVWRWASITKQMAAVIAMQEVEHGRLDLDAFVTRYWPEWRSPSAQTIRVRDLLSHRSGLPQPDESAADARGIPAFYGASAASPAISAASFCAGPVRRPMPTDFEYNNCDSIVLAEVLRRVTGQDFESLVRSRITRQLNMRSVALYQMGPKPGGHVQPTGEYSDIDGLLDMGVYGASGGAYGTIADLWRFDRALMSGRLVSAASRETMWETDESRGFHGFFQWVFPSALTGCGRPLRIVERQGLIGGFAMRNYILPETGQAVIMFARRRPIDYGDPWQNSGLAFDILSRTACPA